MARTQIQSPDIAPGAVNPSKLQPSGVVGGTYSYIQALTVNGTGLITGIVSGRLSYSPNQISPGFALGDLLDTSPSSVTGGQVLVYRSGKWVNESPDFAGVSDHGALTGLLDDDHTQYLTSPRANTWLGTKTTTNLTEGSNLYFTNERAQDAVGSILTASSTLRFTYNDGANIITADVSPANISHNALSNLTVGDPHTQYHTASRADTWLATKTTANITEGSNLYYTEERAQDTVGAMVSPSSAIRWVYSDSAGKLQAILSPFSIDHGALSGLGDDDHSQYHTATRADVWLGTKTTTNLTEGTNLYYTDERVQDAVGSMMSPSSSIRWVYNDSAGKLQALLSPFSIDHGGLSGLGDDDHTQYHTATRADSWLATKTTSNLTEGSNLYFTDERAQDAVGSILANSASIAFTYTDGSNTITASVSPAGVSHNSLGDLTTGNPHTQYQLRSERNTNSGYLGLTSAGLVSPARLGASPAAGEVLYGNNVWASPRLNSLADLRLGFVAPLSNRHHLVWNTGQQRWINELYDTSLASSSDVSVTTPSNGQLLLYEDAIWYNVSPVLIDHGAFGGLGDDDHTQYHTASRANSWLATKNIGELADVSPTTPSDGQVLTWHSSSSRWRNQTPASSGGGSVVRRAEVLVNFRSSPANESAIVTTAVAASWVSPSMLLVCSVSGKATADHDPEDAALEGILSSAANITNGVGFDLITSAPRGTWGSYYINVLGV